MDNGQRAWEWWPCVKLWWCKTHTLGRDPRLIYGQSKRSAMHNLTKNQLLLHPTPIARFCLLLLIYLSFQLYTQRINVGKGVKRICVNVSTFWNLLVPINLHSLDIIREGYIVPLKSNLPSMYFKNNKWAKDDIE